MPNPSGPNEAAAAGVSMAEKAIVLQGLRAQVRRLENGGKEGKGTFGLGVRDIDRTLPDGGLPLGCLHELGGTDPVHRGAAAGFAAALLAGIAACQGKSVLWIVGDRGLHAAGLAAFGLTPDRLIAARARRASDALWAMEEALRCPSLAAVAGEVEAGDLTASRRLHLAAESAGTTAILLLPGTPRRGVSAAMTRWTVTPLPSANEAGEPGIGRPRWRVELLRCRNGRSGAWVLEWRDGALALSDEAAEEGIIEQAARDRSVVRFA
ncbi:hypothetical protein [Azospirillum sp. SYSU D00513]|uniref:ImuA family protein n=1 Tax=Azospirillum sp. SYSU D00513 TaxID=2812561 RepID=UPI001A957D63|nr:hypothetical protein [Azospirillum sp. SYSU D00513]